MASIISFFVGLFSAIKILWAAWNQVKETDQEKIDKTKREVDDTQDKFEKDGRGGKIDV